ncbi:MAG: hypothetical protein MJ146_03820 [Clostridia bacterium]|nr:hypothetical protein [Clostridia bacterium]
MRKFKNFIYKSNDILIAILILLLACLAIAWRMHVIMDYPNTLGDTIQVQQVSEEPEVVSEEPEPAPEPEPQGVWEDGKLTKDVKVTVKGGSAVGAVECLIEKELFTSYAQYEKICKKAGVKPENIKATTFTFKAGSTRSDICKLVTQ